MLTVEVGRAVVKALVTPEEDDHAHEDPEGSHADGGVHQHDGDQVEDQDVRPQPAVVLQVGVGVGLQSGPGLKVLIKRAGVSVGVWVGNVL